MSPAARYLNDKPARVGDVVLRRRRGKLGPEKFLVVWTKPGKMFVGVLIIGNNRILRHYAEDVPAADLLPIGVAEILVADE